jgi:hypothetical protein
MDGNPIHEVTGTKVSYEVNTRDYEDGAHIITVSYENPDVKKTEESLEIVLDNIMYTMTLAAGQNDKFWIVLSNDEGTIYDYQSMKGKLRLDFFWPGDTLIDSFMWSIITEYGTFTEIYTYTKKLPGIDVGEVGDPGNSAGNHIVQIPNKQNYDIIKTGVPNAFASDQVGENSITLSLRSRTSPLFLWLKKKNNEQSYYYYDNEIVIGESTLVDETFFSTKMKELTKYSFQVPEGSDNFFVSLTGYTSETDAVYWECSGDIGTTASLYYPTDQSHSPFIKYRANISYQKTISGYLIFTHEDDYVFEHNPNIVTGEYDPQLEIFTFDSHQAEYKVSQTSTDVNMVASYYEDGRGIQWVVSVPNSKEGVINLPELSVDFLNDLPQGDLCPLIKPASLSVVEYYHAQLFGRSRGRGFIIQ